MPWQEVTVMSQRKEFVMLAMGEDAPIADVCRRFGISRKTGYKWIERYLLYGDAGLVDQSRRPKRSPHTTPEAIEKAVLEVREAHETWGGRKIQRRLKTLGKVPVPAPSTITAILKRKCEIDKEESLKHEAWHRFEAETPNDLWQMDFKRPAPTLAGMCHPLTILDDHSRFNLCLKALPNQKGATVSPVLEETFRRYGLPNRIVTDNGSPWGNDSDHRFTTLTVWLLRLNIGINHSRPYHPQTLGKDERFHRTLEKDLIGRSQWHSHAHLQQGFDRFRYVYNFERPHDALALNVPASRYRLSLRPFPETLPPIEYPSGVYVRKVQAKGEIHFKGHVFKVGTPFHGYPVAVTPTAPDGVFDVFFCHQRIIQIDMRTVS